MSTQTNDDSGKALANELDQVSLELYEAISSANDLEHILKRIKERLNEKSYPDRMKAAKSARDGEKKLSQVIAEQHQNRIFYFSTQHALQGKIRSFEDAFGRYLSVLVRISEALAEHSIDDQTAEQIQTRVLALNSYLNSHDTNKRRPENFDDELIHVCIASISTLYADVRAGKVDALDEIRRREFRAIPIEFPAAVPGEKEKLLRKLATCTKALQDATGRIGPNNYNACKQAINGPQYTARLEKALLEGNEALEHELNVEQTRAKARLKLQHDEVSAEVRKALSAEAALKEALEELARIDEGPCYWVTHAQLQCNAITAYATIRALRATHGKLIAEVTSETPLVPEAKSVLLARAFEGIVEEELNRPVSLWGLDPRVISARENVRTTAAAN